MTQAPAGRNQFLTDFQSLEAAPAWLSTLRESAMARFREIGLPTARKGNEPWKYTNVAPIARAEWAYRHGAAVEPSPDEARALLPWDDAWNTLVFVNGRYSPALSSPREEDRVTVRSIAQALRQDGGPLMEQLGRYARFDEDEFQGFVALNTAFLRDGALVHLPAGTELSSPLHLVYLSTEGVSYPRTLLVAEPGARAVLVETYAGPAGATYFADPVTEILLDEGASLQHYRLILDSMSGHHIGTTRVQQGRETEFTSISFAAGAGIGRNDFKVTLQAPDSSCTLHGLYVTSGDQHIDNYLNIDHAEPHCTSRMYYKGILDGRSRAVFGGTVLVRPGADKTDAHQEDKNLLLSDGAEVASKPSLEIYADDVKCGHGATAGAIADEALFYIRSRGVDEETANVLLVKGFAGEILDEVRVESLRHYLEERTLQALPRFQTAGQSLRTTAAEVV